MLETISTNSIRFLVDFCLWNLTCTTFEGMKIRQPDKQWDEDPGQKISNIRRADGRSIHTQQVWYAPILLARHFQTCDYDATSIFLLLLPICKRCIFIHMRTRPAYPYLYSTPQPPLLLLRLHIQWIHSVSEAIMITLLQCKWISPQVNSVFPCVFVCQWTIFHSICEKHPNQDENPCHYLSYVDRAKCWRFIHVVSHSFITICYLVHLIILKCVVLNS